MGILRRKTVSTNKIQTSRKKAKRLENGTQKRPNKGQTQRQIKAMEEAKNS